jgi:hypothetical protein
MILSKSQAKSMWINETLDLKEIMLNAEWYYKVSNKKTTDAFLITLYALATVWFVFTIHTIYILIK